MSTKLGTTKDSIGLVGYQPNHVARQFGFSQCLPKSLFNRKKNLFRNIIEIIEEEYLTCLAQQVGEHIDLAPFQF